MAKHAKQSTPADSATDLPRFHGPTDRRFRTVCPQDVTLYNCLLSRTLFVSTLRPLSDCGRCWKGRTGGQTNVGAVSLNDDRSGHPWPAHPPLECTSALKGGREPPPRNVGWVKTAVPRRNRLWCAVTSGRLARPPHSV